jgi:translation initiation factor 3 subunit A
MAFLLGFDHCPKPHHLAADLEAGSLMSLVDPVVLPLYDLLEKTFQPLSMYEQLEGAMQVVENHPAYSKYHALLRRRMLLRLLQQLSQVYVSMKFSELKRLFPCMETALLSNGE